MVREVGDDGGPALVYDVRMSVGEHEAHEVAERFAEFFPDVPPPDPEPNDS